MSDAVVCAGVTEMETVAAPLAMTSLLSVNWKLSGPEYPVFGV